MSLESVRRCLMAKGERCVQGPCETCETLSSPSINPMPSACSGASAVAKSEFQNFFNHGVTEVNTVEQSTTVTSVRSYGYKVLWENKHADVCRAEAARSCSLVLSCWVNPFNSDRGDGTSLTVTSARLMHPWKRYCPKLVPPLNTFTAPPDAYTRCKEQHSEKAL